MCIELLIWKKSELRQLIRKEIKSLRNSDSEAQYSLLYDGRTIAEFEANTTSGNDPRKSVSNVNIIDQELLAYFIKELDPNNLSTVTGFELVQDYS